MKKKKIKSFTLDEAIDQHIGKKGSPRRDDFELALQLELIGEMIKKIRKREKLTQEELGDLIGVKKAQISRLESGKSNVTILTLAKVLKALNTEAELHIKPKHEKLALGA